ncbi:unnamed protein product [Lepeophtheirus salmonis]|uniref:(salmon louse) hypothetical protein n=1 Tax=Lepeophtheirus salmonis TaxID=72036 RepID=A0A7R8H3T1_LEPSM|nr:unnamed protein product [Lepeophtheirus salmonis]CAF2848554.1 unnamed protein product [Lepeophtheirus salmonis]
MQGIVAILKSHREKCPQKQQEAPAIEKELHDPAVNIWKELCNHLKNNQQVEKMVRKRYKQFITMAHLLANMLDSSLQGKELNEEVMNMAMEYANEKYPVVVPIIMKFQATCLFFSHLSLKNL